MNDQKSTDVALKFALDGAYLPIGTSGPHEVCPICSGGAGGERTFVLRRVTHDLITFRCYRASCGASGCISVSGGNLVSRESKSLKKQVQYSLGGIDILDEEQIRWICNKYKATRLSLLAAGVRVDALTRRIMQPLYDADGALCGYCLRWHEGIATDNPKPKSLTFWFDEQARIAFPSNRAVNSNARNSLVLVEDWISAFRIRQAGIPAAAILGTGLSQDLLSPIALAGFSNIVLCLDADAKSKALRHKLMFSSMFRNFSVLMLSNLDIKDMEENQFQQTLTDIRSLCGKV